MAYVYINKHNENILHVKQVVLVLMTPAQRSQVMRHDIKDLE